MWWRRLRRLYDSIKECLRVIAAQGAWIRAISPWWAFFVQGETLCFLDAEARPLRNAIVWDGQTARAAPGGQAARALRQ
jgi:sugar (pentulose or hexulose) kinase